MIRRLRGYDNWSVASRDGRDLGTIEDFYFDDQRWTVRYLVARTGSWMSGRSILLSPTAIARVDPEEARFEFRLTAEQIKGAPSVDLAKPVSRQWEAAYAGYYGFPPYWALPGAPPTPTLPYMPHWSPEQKDSGTSEQQHLRSAREVVGYHIQALDGEIGHVDDFVVDDDTWRIRYLLVDTSNWIGGRAVIIAPEWADRVDWMRRRVNLDVTRQKVEDSPEYEPAVTNFDNRPVRLI